MAVLHEACFVKHSCCVSAMYLRNVGCHCLSTPPQHTVVQLSTAQLVHPKLLQEVGCAVDGTVCVCTFCICPCSSLTSMDACMQMG